MYTQNIINISDVDSTNNYALSLKHQKVFREGLVIVTDYQTKGQGQRGDNWESEKGKNLIISFVVELNIPIEKQFDISRIASLSVIDFLSPLFVSISHTQILPFLFPSLFSFFPLCLSHWDGLRPQTALREV